MVFFYVALVSEGDPEAAGKVVGAARSAAREIVWMIRDWVT
jgi:hypothetical protein